MKCTDCHQEIKPVVAVDIDGTLGDYHKHFAWFCSKYWGDRVARYPYDGSGEFEDSLDLSKEEYRQAKLAYRMGGMKRWLPLFADTKPFMDMVANLGAEVWVATTRPWHSVQNIDSDTQWWLQSHGFRVDGLLYGEDKYSLLIDTVGIDRVIGVVDDLPFQLGYAEALGLNAWQVDRSHNKATKWHRRGDLVSAACWLSDRLAEWQERNKAVV